MEVQAGVLGEAHPGPSPGLGSSSSPIALKHPDCHVREKQVEPLT